MSINNQQYKQTNDGDFIKGSSVTDGYSFSGGSREGYIQEVCTPSWKDLESLFYNFF